jgi:hypothetical protein
MHREQPVDDTSRVFVIRKHPRTSVQCDFSYFADGRLGEGTIWDLSIAGFRSTGNVVVAPGLVVNAYLKLPDGEPGHLQINRAVVRWMEGQTMGWEILDMDPEPKARLAHLLGCGQEQPAPRTVIGRTRQFFSGFTSSAAKG